MESNLLIVLGKVWSFELQVDIFLTEYFETCARLSFEISFIRK